MNRIKSILLILAVMLMPMNLMAAEGGGEEKANPCTIGKRLCSYP